MMYLLFNEGVLDKVIFINIKLEGWVVVFIEDGEGCEYAEGYRYAEGCEYGWLMSLATAWRKFICEYAPGLFEETGRS
jgi:hypothetical protein